LSDVRETSPSLLLLKKLARCSQLRWWPSKSNPKRTFLSKPSEDSC